MIVFNESTNLTLKPIDNKTNEITISSYDKEGNENSIIIVCSGAETWETIHIPYENIDMSKSTMVEIDSDTIKRYKDWVNKFNKETKVVYELPMSNNTKITYEPINLDNLELKDKSKPNFKVEIKNTKKKANQNWKKDKFWK